LVKYSNIATISARTSFEGSYFFSVSTVSGSLARALRVSQKAAEKGFLFSAN